MGLGRIEINCVKLVLGSPGQTLTWSTRDRVSWSGVTAGTGEDITDNCPGNHCFQASFIPATWILLFFLKVPTIARGKLSPINYFMHVLYIWPNFMSFKIG